MYCNIAGCMYYIYSELWELYKCEHSVLKIAVLEVGTSKFVNYIKSSSGNREFIAIDLQGIPERT